MKYFFQKHLLLATALFVAFITKSQLTKNIEDFRLCLLLEALLTYQMYQLKPL